MLHVLCMFVTSWFSKEISFILSTSRIRITYQTISELTFFMKVLHFSILNNILQHEINEKVCWTELFFIKNSLKNVTFCCLFWCTGRRRLVFVAWSKTHNKNMSQFSRIFRWRKALSSKLFQRFHVTKCYSEIKNEELLLTTIPSNFFGKLT